MSDRPEAGSPFKDHFSGHARHYAAHRPGYPAELFDFLAAESRARDLAWDCATGNGQAARSLASRFRRVVATDASAEQIASAEPAEGVDFYVAPAEASTLPAGSVDLVTVAQALHWFDLPHFYGQVRRVLRPGGVLAAWTYQLFSLTGELDPVIGRFYGETLARDWPLQRAHVDNGYRDLPFPFAALAPPLRSLNLEWNLQQVLGYLGTWSAVDRYRKRTGDDPLRQVAADLARAWPEGRGRIRVTWPVAMLLGRV